MSTIKSIKVILTKAGTEYDATKEYKLHDYIVVGGSVMYICKRVDADTMVCKGHSLDETEWWDKSVDLSGWVSEAETATTAAKSATEAAKTATTNTKTAISNAESATSNAESATSAAKTATSNAEAATTAAKTATSNADTATANAKTATAAIDTKVATAVSEKYDALVWRGTLDEYNALTDKTAYTLYLIMEEEA